jgi:GT2 family glycosyltransferase
MPLLAAIVVHWCDEARLAMLAAAWPRDDPRFELVIVDNSGSARLPAAIAPPAAGATTDLPVTPGERALVAATAPHLPAAAAEPAPLPATAPLPPEPVPPPVRMLRPGRNLGFAGGVNAGVAASRAPLLLLLNPDVLPEPGALDGLLAGFAAHPEAAGLAPRLADEDGRPQLAWQLRRVPSLWGCLRQTLPWPTADGACRAPARPAVEPAAGTPVEQPAAAALALRREALIAAGGFDERFHPAWFEDVDLARRLRQAGARLLYWPAARFRHALGSTVPRLGYGRFLWIYHRNLERYVAKHHGAGWALVSRASLAAGLLLRLPLTLLRRPRRAATRREGAAGLIVALAGALSGWRLPRRLALDPAGASGGSDRRSHGEPAGDAARAAVSGARR